MGKAKSFRAKTALDASSEGKVICPVCNTEVKKVKLVLARDSKAETWAPKYDMRNMCKCNESDIFSGKY
jgi:uncharacterized Zn finger protein (UPF0148 family)